MISNRVPLAYRRKMTPMAKYKCATFSLP